MGHFKAVNSDNFSSLPSPHPRLHPCFVSRAHFDFNLRHDWNSLLDNDDVEPMTNRTEERWPPADVLVEYLKDYAKPQEAAGKI